MPSVVSNLIISLTPGTLQKIKSKSVAMQWLRPPPPPLRPQACWFPHTNQRPASTAQLSLYRGDDYRGDNKIFLISVWAANIFTLSICNRRVQSGLDQNQWLEVIWAGITEMKLNQLVVFLTVLALYKWQAIRCPPKATLNDTFFFFIAKSQGRIGCRTQLSVRTVISSAIINCPLEDAILLVAISILRFVSFGSHSSDLFYILISLGDQQLICLLHLILWLSLDPCTFVSVSE